MLISVSALFRITLLLMEIKEWGYLLCSFSLSITVILKYEQNELIDLGLGVAEGRYNQEHIIDWVIKHEI